MCEIQVVDRKGQKHRAKASEGMTFMEVVRDAGIDELLALCGGSCSCATCHVYLDPAWISRMPPMSNDENELLDSSDRRDERSRLSCQLKFKSEYKGVTVTIAAEG